MITAIVVLYFALSAFVSVALIAACALSGRTHELSQEMPLSESGEVRLAIAEVQLAGPQFAEGPRPKLQLHSSLSAR